MYALLYWFCPRCVFLVLSSHFSHLLFSCLVFLPFYLRPIFHLTTPTISTTSTHSLCLYGVSSICYGIVACSHHSIIFSNANRKWQAVNKIPFWISYFYWTAHTHTHTPQHKPCSCVWLFSLAHSLSLTFTSVWTQTLLLWLPKSLSLFLRLCQTHTGLHRVQLHSLRF